MMDSPKLGGVDEPKVAFWRDPAAYADVLKSRFIDPLAEAVKQHGRAPRALQLTVLQQLHWYFTVDLRERAPTVALTPSKAPMFHDRVRQVMQHIDAEVLTDKALDRVSVEVRHALMSYQNPLMYSTVVLDAYDHDQWLVRLSYYVHGDPPTESFLIDGVPTKPAYAKYRGCRYFHTVLLRQRIVWLPVAEAVELSVLLNGVAVLVAVGPQPFSVAQVVGGVGAQRDTFTQLKEVRSAFPPGKGGQQPLPSGWTGLKVRLLLALARMPWVRHRFAKAWVFVDRAEDADDNAEHMYRWVRQNHPEINAWFLLHRDSSDWARLASEGFRLVPPGLMGKLTILNSEHIVSSHTEYALGGFDRKMYGDKMRWRFTFIPHGITKDDVSHWLNQQPFDLFITSSPAEQASIVDDDTPYRYTAHDATYAGLARRDRLLSMARSTPLQEVNYLLLMPTWRASLLDDRAETASPEERIEIVRATVFCQAWSALLNSRILHDSAKRHNLQIVIMVHVNLSPVIAAFDVPSCVKVLHAATADFQSVLCKSIALVTDYTSVAFEMAFLRRMTFYYQFDRERFYGGDHNWRPGYFDYDLDGFGPVAFTEVELLAKINHFLGNACQLEPQYLERMKEAMPEVDDQACRRIFESIVRLRQPVGLTFATIVSQ
ncbi:CDP-glycerol glycerophosphotransferase family protein [Rhodoferax sp. PAMC 29310]|uniref:CDP-glycerol glycerophosphotransferase family protein n=1 Tax=Rhodoferax sp. PAMC 29310 TaxID=2822760 RepID=UPI001B33C3FA|nr:CDP-glycerol glycerophosphotransferase family protein [Rhodoferax sp. PAMC 29310]